MQNCTYKLENNTLNSQIVCWIVFRTRLIPKRYVERGRSYIRRKVWLSDALFTFFEFIVYSMVWLVYIVQVCLVYNLWLFYIVRFFGGTFVFLLQIFKLPVIYVGNQDTEPYELRGDLT
jgi:hypothetical protein